MHEDTNNKVVLETEQAAGHIAFDGLLNTRDLGYLSTGSGQRIPLRKLLRSGMLAGASRQDLQRLRDEYELNVVIDFRTAEEQNDYPDPKGDLPGVRFVDAPILNFSTMGITREEALAEQFTSIADILGDPKHLMGDLYAHMLLDETGRQGYQRFFEVLAKNDRGAVLWHCSAGKDRAGLATVLLLTVLEVPAEAIRADYLATNNYLESREEDFVKKLPFEDPPSQLLDSIHILNTADEAFLNTGIRAIEEEYGSIDGYLKGALGVDEATKELIRKRYLVL